MTSFSPEMILSFVSFSVLAIDNKDSDFETSSTTIRLLLLLLAYCSLHYRLLLLLLIVRTVVNIEALLQSPFVLSCVPRDRDLVMEERDAFQ